MRIILLLSTLAIISACSKSLKEKIGITTPGPNEYKVQRHNLLEVPPHYNLPTPVSPEVGTLRNIENHIVENHSSAPSSNLNAGEQALINDIGKH